ncbi:unnamed protein product [Moneuplotes crassus]|uniref:RING-type domain-containing protein n=1 Tax=Euplotes crassus TaxID=5936 RepID=A0AAD1UMA7_EUPCR|nr:unnamed protein product [Moneuplotes crassus]
MWILYYFRILEIKSENIQETCFIDKYFTEEQLMTKNTVQSSYPGKNFVSGQTKLKDEKFELWHVVSTLMICVMYLLFLKFCRNISVWYDVKFCKFIFTVFYFIKSIEFCLIISRNFKNESNVSFDTFCFPNLIAQALYGILFHYQRDKPYGLTLRLFQCSATIFIDMMLLMTSVYWLHLVSYLYKNFDFVVGFLFFWVSFNLYIELIYARIDGNQTIKPLVIEFIAVLSLSCEFIIYANYFELLENNSSSHGGINYSSLFVSVEILTIASYIYHKTKNLCESTLNRPQNYDNYSCNLLKDFTLLQIEKNLVPDCNYCLNSLSQACIDNKSSFNNIFCNESPKYALSMATTYIKTYCGHVYHPTCFLTIKNSTHRCPICESYIHDGFLS